MPFVKIQVLTDRSQADLQDFTEAIADSINKIKDVEKQGISVSLTRAEAGVFGENSDSGVAITFSSFALLPYMTSKLVRSIAGIIRLRLGIPSDRVRIYFENVPSPHLFSLSGRTALELLSRDILALLQPSIHSNRITISRRLVARIVHVEDPDRRGIIVPIGGLAVELWMPSSFGEKDSSLHDIYLGSGYTNEGGYLEIPFDYDSPRDQYRPPFELRIYDPSQPSTKKDSVEFRFPIAQISVPDDRKREVFPLVSPTNERLIRLSYYEYDRNFPFVYLDPVSNLTPFSKKQAEHYSNAEAFSLNVGDKLFGRIDNYPHGLSIDAIQGSFPSKGTTLDKDACNDSDSDEFFAMRLFNGFGPAQLQIINEKLTTQQDRYLSDNEVAPDGGTLYTLWIGWSDLEKQDHLDLFAFRVDLFVSHDRTRVLPVLIWLDPTRTQNLNDWSPKWKFYPWDQKLWSYAKRVVRSHFYNLIGQVQRHLAVGHFNMEQFDIALRRNVTLSPIRNLLFPYLQDVHNINEKGRNTLLGGPAIVDQIESIKRSSIDRWVISTIQCLDWKGWAPGLPLFDGHIYSQAATVFFEALKAWLASFFSENKDQIIMHWGEIYNFSEDLRRNSLICISAPLELFNPDLPWAQPSEHPTKKTGDTAFSIITSSLKPETREFENLLDCCAYIIFHCTFYHSWTHDWMLLDLGELDYSGMISNYGGFQVDDAGLPTGKVNSVKDKYLAPPKEAVFALGSTHTLSQMKSPKLMMNEAGDVHKEFIDELQKRKSDFPEDYKLEFLRSTLAT